jgi:hypothetical protein
MTDIESRNDSNQEHLKPNQFVPFCKGKYLSTYQIPQSLAAAFDLPIQKGLYHGLAPFPEDQSEWDVHKANVGLTSTGRAQIVRNKPLVNSNTQRAKPTVNRNLAVGYPILKYRMEFDEEDRGPL